jgi:hypothetical protein
LSGQTPEQQASLDVRIRAGDWGCALFRNNSGALYDQNGRLVRFGLGNESTRTNKLFKSGDFVGWVPVEITPEMVGKTVAVFANIEAKPAGFNVNRESFPAKSRERAQLAFMTPLLSKLIGLAGFATCAADVDALINKMLERLKCQK